MFSGDSPLSDPRRFLRDAWRDLRGGSEVARRTFLEALARRYRHSALGLLWALLPSLLIVLLISLGQRAQVAGLAAGQGVPPQLQAVLGIVVYQCLMEAFQVQRTLFARHAPLITRQRVPLEGLIVAALAEAIFALVVRLPVLAFALVHYQVVPAPTAVWALVGILGAVVLGAAIGLLVAPWCAVSRDVDSAMALVPWFVLVSTPVFLPSAPVGLLQQVYRFNPLAPVFDAVRAWTFGQGDPGAEALVVLGLALPLLVAAWLLLRVAAPHVVERSLT